MQWIPVVLILPYLLLLIKIFRSLQKIKPFPVTYNRGTFVSVVVACRNEEKDLPNLLMDLSAQNYPVEEFEVIIVDDNSTDSTFKTATGFTSGIDLQVVKNLSQGKKEALKTGIGIAKGNLIITTDADCRMGINWIRSIASFFDETGADMIICPVRIEKTAGFFGKFQELEFLSLQGVTAGTANYGNGTMCNGANLAFKKEAYFKNLENLRFDIPTGDDVFFLHSLKQKPGSKILWLESSEAIVITSGSSSLREYFNQRKRWLSKSSAYSDTNSILLGIVTFVTILIQISLMIAACLNQIFIPVFLVFFLMKSVPDYLILRNTAYRYERKYLIKWFLPAQIIYAFYVIAVTGYSVLFQLWSKISYPFQIKT